MNISAIKNKDIANGVGIRCSVFVSGCEAHCKNCFNPETWDFDNGYKFTCEVKESLFKELDSEYITGLSVLGGEPLHPANVHDVIHLLDEFKQRFPNKTVWLYSGYTWEEITKNMLYMSEYEWTRYSLIKKYVDVLVDGRFVDELKDISLKWRGSSNQRVIDVKKTFANRGQTIDWHKNIVLYCD